MRISDWSSDVCSSDLGPIIFIEGVIARSIHCLQLIEHICEPYSFVVIGAAFEEACTGDRMRFGTLMAGEDLIRHVIGGTGDRKSVVSGKSVSVRVDLGGRRSIKKKNT